MIFKRTKFKNKKKIIDLNDKNNITQLSRDIDLVQGIDQKLVRPIHGAIDVLKDYDETHNLSIEQIRKIYDNLNINEQMSPEEMEESLKCVSNEVAILDKKFVQASLDKKAFSSLVRGIMKHFINIIDGNILSAITEIIENFSCICMLAKNNFSFKDICFKFFTKHPESEEILVLILNITYQQATFSYNLFSLFKFEKEQIRLNFLGALIKTDIPD